MLNFVTYLVSKRGMVNVEREPLFISIATDNVADLTGFRVLTGLKVLNRRIGPPISNNIKAVRVTPIRAFMYHFISDPNSFSIYGLL